jgi:four helix bundle protein
VATIKDFEDLDIWKSSRLIVKNVYSDFSGLKDYSFKDQICRAAISIMNNISEGFARGGNKEFIQFLKVARGSAAEVKNMYYIASDLSYITDNQSQTRQKEVQGIMNGISSLIKYLRTQK